jgi:hypothetical protein
MSAVRPHFSGTERGIFRPVRNLNIVTGTVAYDEIRRRTPDA